MAMQKLESTRIGRIVNQIKGYEAYIPNKLYPEKLFLNMDLEIINLLSEADRALGELKGVTETVPNPDLFVAYYVRKEALLSSQIEGTQCSLDEVLQADEKTSEMKPVQEVVNYINAMNRGLEELKNIPMSLRLIHTIHKVLLDNVRGKHKYPGEYKRSQNWIGPSGCLLPEAIYVPPPPELMLELMGDWEQYYHSNQNLPPLIKAAILHSHFETIHPYIDGNGRLGRLLVTFSLCEKGVIDRPLLYLSLFFKENRTEYYKLLMDVRFKGEIEQWLKFFLRGVRSTSREAIQTANDIKNLMDIHLNLIKSKLSKYRLALPLYDLICEKPILSIGDAAHQLKSTYPTMKQLFQKLADYEILKAYDTNLRNKRFAYADYLDILRRGT